MRFGVLPQKMLLVGIGIALAITAIQLLSEHDEKVSQIKLKFEKLEKQR